MEEMSSGKSLPTIEHSAPPPAAVAPAPAQPAQPAQPAPAAAAQPAPPPLPPTGLPEGWTQDQWNHFGWQYVESLK